MDKTSTAKFHANNSSRNMRENIFLPNIYRPDNHQIVPGREIEIFSPPPPPPQSTTTSQKKFYNTRNFPINTNKYKIVFPQIKF